MNISTIKLKTNKMTLLEHIEKEAKFLKNQIKKGKEPNRNNLDGYVLKGLEDKLKVLSEFYQKLKKTT